MFLAISVTIQESHQILKNNQYSLYTKKRRFDTNRLFIFALFLILIRYFTNKFDTI